MTTLLKSQFSGFGLYVHWPFCHKKCPYCDYNSHVREEIDHDTWSDALCRELSFFAGQVKDKQALTSVFFGGGTPSLMHPKTVERILNTAKDLFGFVEDIEITLEANPTSSESQKFEEFRQAGVNRLSIGVQALNDKDLKFLGREHSVKEALQVIEMAAKTFNRFSFDLIYGRPNQTLKSWTQELDLAMQFAVGHISLYQLTIEPGTQFATQYKRGDFQLPGNDQEAQLYDVTGDILAKHGFHHYEISSYAKPHEESRHNLVYWRYGDYIGIGPGAHGRIETSEGRIATKTHTAPEVWLDKVLTDGQGTKPSELLSTQDIAQEMLMMGLRISEGMCLETFEHKTGQSITDYVGTEKLEQLISEDYLVIQDNRLKTTDSGRRTLDSILAYC